MCNIFYDTILMVPPVDYHSQYIIAISLRWTPK